jgi:hypothetical protein
MPTLGLCIVLWRCYLLRFIVSVAGSFGSPLLQPWPSFDCAYWSSAAPLIPQPGDHSCAHPMPKHKERLRGRPRRGSPWRPRRPSFSPPASPPTDSAIHPQAETLDPTSLNPPTMNFNCLELVPRLPSSSLRLLLAPLVTEPVHSPSPVFPRDIGADQPPPARKPGYSGAPTSDSTKDDQLKDKLAILYGLVFELRQGVEDLHFRLQLTNEKVAQFLQLLSSLYETVLSPPEPAADATEGKDQVSAMTTGDTSMQDAATTGEDVAKQSAAGSAPERSGNATKEMKDNARNGPGAATTEQFEVQWGDRTTCVEEEPWPGDLSATWPGYASGV